MAERADAFMALPGSIGTFEEFFEVWTWRQLEYHDKPIGLLNMNGYYDSLLAFLKPSIPGGFMPGSLMPLISVETRAELLLESLVLGAGLTAALSRSNQQLDQI